MKDQKDTLNPDIFVLNSTNHAGIEYPVLGERHDLPDEPATNPEILAVDCNGSVDYITIKEAVSIVKEYTVNSQGVCK